MAELDIEELKRRVDEMVVSQGMPGIKAAIREALEDRDRLRAVIERIDRIVERMYLPPEFAHFQAELVRALALEGCDGA